ncbi:MAG: hypothetical protein PWQ79_2198 [Thermococcaceae archaeon]|nr:hypothetical protein [Thermococcaceae archaeon]
MKVKDAWPVTAPLVIDVMRLAVLVAMFHLLIHPPEHFLLTLILIALLFGLVSSSGVELRDGKLILGYGPFFRFNMGEVLEVADLGKIQRGRLIWYIWRDMAVPVYYVLLPSLLFRSGELPFIGSFIYLAALYSISVFVPLHHLKERTDLFVVLAMLLPWLILLPFRVYVSNWPSWVAMHSFFGFLYFPLFVAMDYVLLSTERRKFVLRCHNSKNVITEVICDEG